MRINLQNSISFTSIPIYNVKLKKNSNGTIDEFPATFSKLERYDREDRAEMRRITSSWATSRYGSKIASHFLGDEPEYDDDEFYAIESPSSEKFRTIYSIAQVSPHNHQISYLQANPRNKMSGIKGSGEVMLWGIGKDLRQDVNGLYFQLYSSPNAVGFYKHLGLISDGSNNDFFFLNQDNGPKFFNRVKEEYHLDTKV